MLAGENFPEGKFSPAPLFKGLQHSLLLFKFFGEGAGRGFLSRKPLPADDYLLNASAMSWSIRARTASICFAVRAHREKVTGPPKAFSISATTKSLP